MIKIKNIGIRGILNFNESIAPGETKEVELIDPVILDRVQIIEDKPKTHGGGSKWSQDSSQTVVQSVSAEQSSKQK